MFTLEQNSSPVIITLGDNGKILDVDFVQWILNEIGDLIFKRKQVAATYAILISKGQKDFKEINAAIIKRWSVNALIWIKKEAWRQFEGAVLDAANKTARLPRRSGSGI